MRYFLHFEIKIKFEETNSAGSSINILEHRISFFSNIENEENEKKMKIASKKKNVVRISKVESIKKIKRISRNSRSKKWLTSSNKIFVDVAAYNFYSKQKNVKLFVLSFKNIDDQMQKNTNISIDFKTILSEKFHDKINVLFKLTSNKLTSHREHDHKIKLQENQKLKHSSFKNMSFQKSNFVEKYFENNLKKEFIIVSYALYFSSILLIKKSNDKLRFCVNYGKLNQMTKKNKYSILSIIETFAQLFQVKTFSKINIR